MFGTGLAEEQKSIVTLPAIPPQALPIIIDFIYTGIFHLLNLFLVLFHLKIEYKKYSFNRTSRIIL